jgi:arylsulfatase A-like enzyme
MILLDNFTYTIFKIGIVTSAGVWRALYGLGFVILFFFFHKKTSSWLQPNSIFVLLNANRALWILMGVSTITFLLNIQQFHLPNKKESAVEKNLPNIILIGIDGVNATHMSVYGYERDTTPAIKKRAQQALVVENGFANTGKTGGSLTSVLTGKLAPETRVYFPPDILLGEDAYQHLPGILKQQGYHTVQVTMQYYGDAYERNLRDGFDIVNGRSQIGNLFIDQFASLGGGAGMYFNGQIVLRVAQRVEHIFFIQTMENPYAAVTDGKFAWYDEERMKDVFQYLDESEGPIFLHLHMMDTHGPLFDVPVHFYTTPDMKMKNWDLDFFDDAIRSTDIYINDLFEHLEKTGKLDNTIIILFSDHTIKWNTLQRVPMIFWFPNHEYAGSVDANAQLIDISPTILDYLNIPQPEWMSGVSVLNSDISPTRPVFSAVVGEDLLRVTDDRKTWIVDQAKISPPFYQVATMNVVVCNQWYSLDLRAPALTYGDVIGSTSKCAADEIPTPEEALTLIIQDLANAKYDVSSLQKNIPIQKVVP